jgi:hypothetical protein
MFIGPFPLIPPGRNPVNRKLVLSGLSAPNMI